MSENMSSRSNNKFDLWERKLLDLTTRNALLNVRLKGNTIPLFAASASDIEDRISAEKEYIIISRTKAENEQIHAHEYGVEGRAETHGFSASL